MLVIDPSNPKTKQAKKRNLKAAEKAVTTAFNNLGLSITDACNKIHLTDDLKLTIRCDRISSCMKGILEDDIRKQLGLPRKKGYRRPARACRDIGKPRKKKVS